MPAAPSRELKGRLRLAPQVQAETRLRFDVDRRDSPCFADTAFLRIALQDVPASWDAAGKAFRMNIGGAEAEFLLDRSGRGRGSMGRVQLQRRGGFAGGEVVARIALRGNWADEWADEGVSPAESDGGSPLDLGVRIDLEGTEFAGGATPWMVSRPGKLARIVLE